MISLTITLWSYVMSASPFYYFILWWQFLVKPCRQISNSLVAIFEVFHTTFHSAGNHAGISTDMTKSIKVVCSRTALLHEELNHSTLVKQYSIFSCSHFFAVFGAHVLDLYSRLQKTDTPISSITLSLVMLIKQILFITSGAAFK
jgi:hypothetical protein